MTIEIISGSGRRESLTIRAALALQNWLRENTAHQIGLISCSEESNQLPPLQHVFTSVENTPDPYKPLSERIFSADAFIWVSPEYNGSYSPALKNILDHYPKQLRKPVGIVTASNGNFGGLRAAQQLLLLASGLFAICSPQLLIVPAVDKKIDESGVLIDENFYKSIHNFVTEFIWLAEKITG